jgi:hypothetical protein
MKQDEKSPNKRIARLGEQLIQVLEQEEDHSVVLSALAFVTAAGCSSLAGEASGAGDVPPAVEIQRRLS